MVSTIDVARREVQSAFERIVAIAEGGEPRAAVAFEAEAWVLLLALGRALMVVFLVRQVARPRAAHYSLDGADLVLRGERCSEIRTLFGKVPFTRPIGRRVRAARAKADLPIDRELGRMRSANDAIALSSPVRYAPRLSTMPASTTLSANTRSIGLLRGGVNKLSDSRERNVKEF